MIVLNVKKCPLDYPVNVFNSSVLSLKEKGLVHVNFVKGGSYIWNVRLSRKGKIYISENPNLTNPVNWSFIFAILSLLISIISLFVSCMMIKKG
jgi:hypothetical protein